MSIELFKNQYEEVFIPDEYLKEYYLQEPDIEAEFIISFIVSLRVRLGLSDLMVLEFGGGPSLYTAAALIPFAREIQFTDYLSANLKTVAAWLEHQPGAFNWNAYTRLALLKEGCPAQAEDIQRREEEIRQKITVLLPCNGLDDEPVPQGRYKYDFVSALYCTDIIASNTAEWYNVISNISTLIRPGGYLMLGLTRGISDKIFYYPASGLNFPCTDLSTGEIREGYSRAGFELDSLIIEERKASPAREYKHLIMTVARKPGIN